MSEIAPNRQIDCAALPAAFREPFRQFGEALLRLAGDNLLALTAFGGWVVQDPFDAGTAAHSVVVLGRLDLEMLDRLASEGLRFGKQQISAPLIMTPEYIRASCDAFPLELLEIQQLHAAVVGEDHFAGLKFEPRDVRLQCERELKSELIQLRQGLLASAGRRKFLPELCLACARRTVRVLRGVLYLAGGGEPPRLVRDVVARAIEVTKLPLAALQSAVTEAVRPDFAAFQRVYGDVAALAEHVDRMAGAAGA